MFNCIGIGYLMVIFGLYIIMLVVLCGGLVSWLWWCFFFMGV